MVGIDSVAYRFRVESVTFSSGKRAIIEWKTYHFI